MRYFKAFTFEGKNAARKAFEKLEWKDDIYFWLDDVAEISVNKRGTYRVHSTWSQDSRNVPERLGHGALVGGVLGTIFGPGGAITGAVVGGSIGGLIGHHINVKFNNPILDDFAATLLNDTSALVMIGDNIAVAELTKALADYELKIFEAELDEEVEKSVKKALQN